MSEYIPLPTVDQDDLDERKSHPSQRRAPNKKNEPSKFSLRLLACGAFLVLFGWVCYRLGQLSIKPSLGSQPDLPKPSSSPTLLEEKPIMTAGRKLNVGYFTNWGIYGRKYPPSLIPTQQLTHILYAFANVRPDSGEVYLSDLWSDQDIHYPGDSWNDAGTNLYGNFKQIYLLKKNHRHLKLLLSIGGWTYSPSFHPVVVSSSLRAEFVRSSIKLLEDYGIDGLDIDYEYPRDEREARGYVDLLRELREGLDQHARQKNLQFHYPLTIAAPCGPQNYEKLFIKEMDQYLDFWNLMAYDYSGSWDAIANHQANVFSGPIGTDRAVDYFVAQGVPRCKLVIGIPLYGRSFMATTGPGQPFSGVGPGTWEQGSYDYRALPLPGSTIHHDKAAIASWSYDPVKKEMISFDDEKVAKRKAKWIIEQNLGGAMYWELSGDKGGADRPDMEKGEGKTPQPGESLVEIVSKAFGKLDDTPNCLDYTQSKFENLRKGM